VITQTHTVIQVRIGLHTDGEVFRAESRAGVPFTVREVAFSVGESGIPMQLTARGVTDRNTPTARMVSSHELPEVVEAEVRHVCRVQSRLVQAQLEGQNVLGEAS